MELRHLRTFVHVAELGSISLAAERLHLAQSALSRHIQAIETELQVRLFRRHGRGVVLTPQGATLLTRANVILRELDLARLDIKSEPAVLTGEVSFGMPPTVADAVSGALIEKYSRLYPQVKLKIASGYSGHVLDWLQRGIVDLGVLYEAKQSPTIKSQPLLVEHLFFVEQAHSHGNDEVTFEELASCRLVLPSRQHGLRLLVDAIAARSGYQLSPTVEVDSLPLQIDLVRRGLGATILPFLSVSADVKAGTLSARPIVTPAITRRLVLASAIHRPITPAVQRFAEMVTSETAELVNSGKWKGTLLAHETAQKDAASA